MILVLEGLDGTGKTTIANRLVNHYEKQGYKVSHLRDPGGEEIAEKIRKIILDVNNTYMCDECEALLYAASRAQFIKNKLIKENKENDIVIMERFVESSIAYQGARDSLDKDWIRHINRTVYEIGYYYVIYIDIEPELSLSRITGEKDRLENQDIEFFRKVAKNYQSLLENEPSIYGVNGRNDLERVYSDIEKLSDELFKHYRELPLDLESYKSCLDL